MHLIRPRALAAAAALALLAALAPAAPARAQRSSAGSPRDRMVVSAEWLATHIKDPDLVLLHVGDSAQYAAEHLPGARFASLTALHRSRSDSGLSLEMLPADSLRARLQALGISDRSRIVVYYGADWVTPTTRVLFTLDWFGLGDRASMLDGGMSEWKRAGGAVTAAVPTVRPGALSARTPRADVVVANDWVKQHLAKPGVTVVDARAPVFYQGPANEHGQPGHIPGAVNVPFTELVDESLKLYPTARLAETFARAGVPAGDTIVAYCHIGQQATAVVFAARLLGRTVVLYDGSMQDWSRRNEPLENAQGKRVP